MDRVIIVASGPSGHRYSPPRDVSVIAVNGAINYAYRADYWFTLDPSAENMEIMRNRRRDVLYYCANDGKRDLPRGVMSLDRVSTRGDEPEHKNSPEWWLWRWSATLGLNEDSRKISSGNSAYGALGLAYHMGAKKVLLVGVDGTQDAKEDGTLPRNLSHLPMLFASAIPQIEFVSAGLLCINQMGLKEGERWLMG